MDHSNRLRILKVIIAFLIFSSEAPRLSAEHSTEPTKPAELSQPKEEDGTPGRLLWLSRCSTCHNLRNPRDFSKERWRLLMMHMKIKSNLTSQENDKILKFMEQQLP
ncbi:MAG: hypothetical protein KA436_06420 [Oligoflexales bacterium]|nr:hypothetical protein [Oligoflexales bacterium]